MEALNNGGVFLSLYLSREALSVNQYSSKYGRLIMIDSVTQHACSLNVNR